MSCADGQHMCRECGELVEEPKLLSPQEEAVIEKLAAAWNHFVELRQLHPNDRQEFAQAIHAAQNIVMARPVMRQKP